MKTACKTAVLIVGEGWIPDFAVKGEKSNFCNSWGKVDLFLLTNTTSVPNFSSFDFFDPKFDHSSYSKNLYKHCQIWVILEDLVLMKHPQ